jgi:hypothetical protein
VVMGRGITVTVLTATSTWTSPLLSSFNTPDDPEVSVAPEVTVTIEVSGAWQASTVTVRFRLASAGSERRRMAIKAVGNEVHMFICIKRRPKRWI